MKGKISEVYESVQGEGIYFGEKQLFVRFFECNLKCKFCDTPLKYFKEYDPDELFLELQQYGNNVHSVSFTGGEPLMQNIFLKNIMRLTSKYQYLNYLDTNGTLPEELKEVIEYADIVSMDMKLPSSTGEKSFWDEHKIFLKVASQKEVLVKIVVCGSTSENDLIEALKIIKETNPYAILILQPNSFESSGLMNVKLENFKNICLAENITTCIIPQMHKIIGVR